MKHATTYDTMKLKQAPGMVVHGERDHQLQSYVYRLHLLNIQPLKRKHVSCLPAKQEGATSLFYFVPLSTVWQSLKYPCIKNNSESIGEVCVELVHFKVADSMWLKNK